jgi:putative ABC transport system permease protein
MGTYFPVFNVDNDTLGLAVLYSFAVGILSAIIPTYRAIKIPIADGLRSIG